jgi:SAM-dependent methyltransferase
MDLGVTDPERCTVLELGCGAGGNLLPLAEQYPHSSFVGVDAAVTQVEAARGVAQAIGAHNVTFVAQDLSSYQVEAGRYDYIICHGVFSWVAPAVQSRILEICSQGLAPTGVAFISYNILPGWRQRGALRDIIRFGATLAKSADETQRLEGGLKFLELVAATRPTSSADLYGSYLAEGVARLRGSDRSYLLHEFLEEHNTALLFTDFMQCAQGVGLQYLAEARPAFMYSADLPVEFGEFLAQAVPGVLEREQVLDIARNRMLRETLLCRAGHQLKRDLRASLFRQLHFSTEYRAGGGSLDAAEVQFTDLLSGRAVTLPRSPERAVLAQIAAAGAAGLPFGALQGEPGATMRAVVTVWQAGFLDAVVAQVPVCVAARDGELRARTALTSKLARYQAAAGPLVTSLRHRTHELSSPERIAISMSDGTRTFSQVAAAVEQVARGTAQGALARLGELGFFTLAAADAGAC